MRIVGAAIETFATGPGPRSAGGKLNGVINFAARGTSPRTAVAALQGNGTIIAVDGKVAGLWPGAIRAAVDAAQGVEADKLGASLKESLAAGLGGAPVALPASIALELTDGRLRLKALQLDTAEGRAAGSASIDLASLAFQSDWRLEPKGAAGEKPLPAVPVVYRGALGALGSSRRSSTPIAWSARSRCVAWSATWRNWSACASSTRRAAVPTPNACASSSSARRRPRPGAGRPRARPLRHTPPVAGLSEL